MAAKPGIPGHHLALLDVLCCGLGAAVLLLMMLRQTPADAAPAPPTPPPPMQTLDEAQAARAAALERAATARNALAEARAAAQAAQTQRRKSQEELRSVQAQAQADEEQTKAAADGLEAALQKRAQGLEEEEQRKTRNRNLAGLQVKGDRVAVLLDASASMLHESIVQIVRLKAAPKHVQRGASKWTRARDAARWALAQVPKGGRRTLLLYSDQVLDPSGNPIYAARWTRQEDPDADAKMLRDQLEAVAPAGPTDLKSALFALRRIRPKQVILITDGLPTLPGKTSLRKLAKCPRVSSPKHPIISAQCRLSIFVDAINNGGGQGLAGAQYDAVLLPLEGDAQAIDAYWHMAAWTGGRLLAPGPGWPEA